MERYVVIGIGAFGGPVARRLAERGQDVLAIDRNGRLVEELKDDVARAVVADATDRDTLESLGVPDFTTAVVAIGEHREANILITALLRELGIPRIVARATSPLHARILTAIGAHKVIFPEQDYGEQLADNLVSAVTLERFPLAEGIVVAELPTHPNMHGRSLRELSLRERFAVNVVAMRMRKRTVDDEGQIQETMETATFPDPDLALTEGSVLVVVGTDEALDALTEAFGR
jgi:trk system potassium uptake protein TrkA